MRYANMACSRQLFWLVDLPLDVYLFYMVFGMNILYTANYSTTGTVYVCTVQYTVHMYIYKYITTVHSTISSTYVLQYILQYQYLNGRIFQDCFTIFMQRITIQNIWNIINWLRISTYILIYNFNIIYCSASPLQKGHSKYISLFTYFWVHIYKVSATARLCLHV